MKALAISLILSLSCLSGFAQTLRITFMGTGDANHVDWIKATNLSTNRSVTLPGYETLNLRYLYPDSAGKAIIGNPFGNLKGIIWPNPFQGSATLQLNVNEEQTVNITVRNLAGQVIAQSNEFMEAGVNNFALTLADDGIYIITMATVGGVSSFKAICSGTAAPQNTIRHIGCSGDASGFNPSGLKSMESGYWLNVTKGDRILYTCTSGDHTTLVTDVPKESRRYAIKFTACVDKQGKNYPVIHVNGQTWMAENLTYLPMVSASYTGSTNQPHYYVYNFQESNVEKAKKSKAYEEYGVLYNWPAARSACPEGWKVPTDAEWQTMERFLGMNSMTASVKGWRASGNVGNKLKETGHQHWNNSNSSAVNSLAFSARAGGLRLMPFPSPEPVSEDGTNSEGPYGTFSNLGSCGIFWTSTPYNQQEAWYRRFGCVESGVERLTSNKSLGFSVRCIRDYPKD
jgi:uncharacterized protein (TIGR02145 family)